jgi:hypothetical protein
MAVLLVIGYKINIHIIYAAVVMLLALIVKILQILLVLFVIKVFIWYWILKFAIHNVLMVNILII